MKNNLLKFRYLCFLILFPVFSFICYTYWKLEYNNTVNIVTKNGSSVLSAKIPPIPRQKPLFLKRSNLNKSIKSLPGNLREDAEKCRSIIVVDWTDKKILYEKNSEKAYPIASLTKMFTALQTCRLLKEKPERYQWDMAIPISPNINKNVGRGSEVDLDPRETFSLEDLFSFMLIHSANDAAYQIAETLGDGKNDDAFVRAMNDTAKEIGWKSFKFYNPHGLPEKLRRSAVNSASARELAELSGMLLQFPMVMKYAGMPYKKIPAKGVRKGHRDLYSRHESVRRKRPYIIGLKTGTTADAGYCISTVAQKEDKIIIVILLGCPNNATRVSYSEKLAYWGLTQ